MVASVLCLKLRHLPLLIQGEGWAEVENTILYQCLAQNTLKDIELSIVNAEKVAVRVHPAPSTRGEIGLLQIPIRYYTFKMNETASIY